MLENSGVAEPQNIRDKFTEAILMNNPLMSRIQLDTMATIVDSGSFTADYSSRTPVSGIHVLASLHATRPHKIAVAQALPVAHSQSICCCLHLHCWFVFVVPIPPRPQNLEHAFMC